MWRIRLRQNHQKSLKNQTTGDVDSSFLLKVIGSRSFQVHFVFMYILCVWYIIHIVPKTATRDSPFHRSHGFGRPSADNPSLKVDSRGNEKWPVKTCIDWFVPTKLIYQIGYTLREYKGWPSFFLREFTLPHKVYFSRFDARIWYDVLIMILTLFLMMMIMMMKKKNNMMMMVDDESWTWCDTQFLHRDDMPWSYPVGTPQAQHNLGPPGIRSPGNAGQARNGNMSRTWAKMRCKKM